MNEQQRPFVPNVTGYPVQYATQPIAPRGVQPTPYQYTRMQYPIGQTQLMMNAPTQPRPIHNAGPPAGMSSPATVVRKRAIPEAAAINAMNPQVKKKRAIDRNIPEKLDTLVPESRLYTELQEFERKLDSTIVRKKLEITESLSKPMKVKRTLRVFISNTSCNQQPIQEADGNEIDYGSNIPAWTLRIEGRLLDPINAKSTRPPTRKFSHFFKSIIVELDRDPEMYPEGNLIEWNKAPDSDDVDGFEIKRKGDANLKAKIFLNLDQQPPRYKLSPELESVLDIQEETKQGIIMALWQYIKHNNLQDNEDKRIINNDMRLYGIFNAPRIAFPQVPELISKHLAPVDPIVIEYTIRIDKEFHQSRYAYDIEVELDDPNKMRLAALASNSVNQKEIHNLDDKIVQCVQSINNSKTKRDFLLNFSNSPIDFINKWIASQSRDLEVILGESKVNLEEQRKSEFYKQDWVNEAVFHYTNAQTQRRMQELLGASSMNRNDQRFLNK